MVTQKRRPLRLDKYLRVHTQHMEHLQRSGLVEHQNLKPELHRHEVYLRGKVWCPGQVILKVNKKMRILDWDGQLPIIKTVAYEYNASLEGLHSLFRYDNTHKGKPYSGHYDDFHKHIFDLETGKQIPKSPIWIGKEKWPTLDLVIEEAGLMYSHHQELIESVINKFE